MMSKRFEHGGNIYSVKTIEGHMPLLDFSANINPLGLSDKVRKAIADNIEGVVHYPDPDMTELADVVSKYYDVDKEHLVFGNGATELIYLLCRVLKIKKTLIPAPSFSEYERAAIAAGMDVKHFYLDKEKSFHVDYDELLCQIDEGTLLFLGNPNNPTGNLLDKENFPAFMKSLADKKSCLLLDESFIDFLTDTNSYSLRRFYKEYENLFVVHSMTKFFAIPGLRLGFGVLPPAVTVKIKAATDCWNVNMLAQKAGVVALTDTLYIEKSKQEVKKLRESFQCALKSVDKIKVFEPSVNFILLDISPSGMNADVFCEKMRSRNILIRNCDNYPGLGQNYVRVAVRTQSENERFINNLKELL